MVGNQGNIVSILINKLPAPNVIIEFVTCKCSQSSCQKKKQTAVVQNRNLHVQKANLCLGHDDCENEYKDVEMDKNGGDKSDSYSESSVDN